jgi:nicotinate dehydrogenase subunit B
MLFARILRPAAYGASVISVETSMAERMPGVVTVVREGDLVAVLADTDEAADRAHDLLTAEWAE